MLTVGVVVVDVVIVVEIIYKTAVASRLTRIFWNIWKVLKQTSNISLNKYTQP